jgi:hypothetical protein
MALGAWTFPASFLGSWFFNVSKYESITAWESDILNIEHDEWLEELSDRGYI